MFCVLLCYELNVRILYERIDINQEEELNGNSSLYLLDEWKHFLSMKNVSAKRLEFPMAAASGTVQYSFAALFWLLIVAKN